MKTSKYVVWVLFAIFMLNCEREWTNPFDPDCPKEIWTPSGFTAHQNNNVIELTWTQGVTQISGFRIERKVGSGDWQSVASPGKSSTSWSDSNISGGVLHEYKLYAVAGENKSNMVTASETPLINAAVQALDATNITQVSAVLNGTVNANGSPTTVKFKYKTENSADWITVNGTPQTVSGNTNTPVSAVVQDLIPASSYVFKITVINSAGENESNTMVFNTPCYSPLLELLTPTNLGETTVTINGRVNARGSSVTISCEYGETTSFGKSVPGNPSTITGTNYTNVSFNLSGLKAGFRYYYRIKAISCGYTTYSTTNSVDTQKPCETTVTNPSASSITDSGAKISGLVTTNAKLTYVYIQYGTDTGYGSQVNASPSTITTSAQTSVGATLSNLQPNTRYYYRIKTVNECGTTYSSPVTYFTTLCTKASVSIDKVLEVTSATVNFTITVNANGFQSNVYLNIRKSTETQWTVSQTILTVTGSSNVTKEVRIGSLSSNTTYYVRVLADNCGGTAVSNTISFRTNWFGVKPEE